MQSMMTTQSKKHRVQIVSARSLVLFLITAVLNASRLLVLPSILGLSACATPGQDMVNAALIQGQPGYQLAVESFACWFGGLWADAEGIAPPDRARITEGRCRAVTSRVYTGPVQHHRAMRAIDPKVVDDVANKVGADAGADRQALVSLVHLVADAQREATAARRAALRVKHDLNKDLSAQTERTRLDQDEVAALAPLHVHEALDRLLQLSAGPFAGDAHALALLVATDRMNTVRGLPKHLKLYAMDGPGHAVFGIPSPQEMPDPMAPLTPGVWLAHLSAIARAAGYPVPDDVTRPVDRAVLAWNGVLKGFADRLKQDEAKLSLSANPTLRPVVVAVEQHLSADYDIALRAVKGK